MHGHGLGTGALAGRMRGVSRFGFKGGLDSGDWCMEVGQDDVAESSFFLFSFYTLMNSKWRAE